MAGAGILVSNSADVEVTQNLLAGNANGVLLREDRRVTRDAQDTYRQGIPHIQGVVVSDNDIATAAGGVTGMEVFNGDGSASWWQQANAWFSGNTYRSAPGGLPFLGPDNNHYSYDQWRALGNDPGSALRPTLDPGSLPRQATAFVASRYGALALNGRPHRARGPGGRAFMCPAGGCRVVVEGPDRAALRRPGLHMAVIASAAQQVTPSPMARPPMTLVT